MQALNAFLAKVVVEIVNPIILLLAGGAFIMFLWGAFKFVKDAGDATAREEGRSALLWGVVGLAVLFGAYGIINLALGTFDLSPVRPISH